MGHVINPISARLGYTRFWSANWALSKSSSNISYSYLGLENDSLIKYIIKLSNIFLRRLTQKGFILINIQLLRFYNLLLFILTSHIKFISSLFKVLKKGLDSMFTYKRVQYKWSSLTTSNVRYRNHMILKLKQLLNTIPYKVATKKRFSQTISLGKKNNKYRRFLSDSKKAVKYIFRTNDVDLIGYNWSSITKFLSIKKPFKVIFKSHIVNNLLKYLIFTRWIVAIKKFIIILTHRFLKAPLPVEILLVALSTNALTASFVSKYLATRLLQKFPLRRLMSTIIRQLKLAKENAIIQGFKVACNGRFARRGRATHTWKNLGNLPRSDTSVVVDYSILLPVLTNSICAVKVWLTRTRSSTKLFVL